MKGIKFGITGKIASGKSYAADKICKSFQTQGLNCQLIDGDLIRRYILHESTTSAHQLVRQNIAELLSIDTNLPFYFFDNRLLLSDKWFSDFDITTQCNTIMKPAIISEIKLQLDSKADVFILESATIFQDALQHLINGNVLTIECSKKTQMERLENSDLPAQQLKNRIAYQDYIYALIAAQNIEIQKSWKINTDESPPDSFYTQTANRIMHDLS